MKKIFVTLVGLFLLSEIGFVLTDCECEWMNITGFTIVGIIAVLLDKKDAEE